MQIRQQVEAARLMKEEPERFFLIPAAGVMTESEYRKAVGIPAEY